MRLYHRRRWRRQWWDPFVTSHSRARKQNGMARAGMGNEWVREKGEINEKRGPVIDKLA